MRKLKNLKIEKKRGLQFPFGAIERDGGVNFALYAKQAIALSISLYLEDDLQNPIITIPLEPAENKTGDIWHIFLKGLPPAFAYDYQITLSGQQEPIKHVLDPYAKIVASDPVWHHESRTEFLYSPRGKFATHQFDWESDRPLQIPKKDLIIYEMHVRGFTCHTSSKVSSPGTFKGIMEKIPYLVDLGINAVELMPIQEFCEEDVIQRDPHTGKKLHNYFGYSTVNFFSLMNRFASQSKEDQALVEFKTLVKELHKNGIEVILDVVFNHTFEGNENGPSLSYKALDSFAYYFINEQCNHMNFSGCGNTFNCNHPISRVLIIDVLRYWVLEYHIDGFRFDLASVFSRDKSGAPKENTALLEFLSVDPVLSATKLIAEPWDPGGLYELGKFAALDSRWSEWDGRYQSTLRNFIKGTPHQKQSFAGALCAYHELFPNSPYSSVNYVTCHDGFSLADLVSYNHKKNEENGEENRDGSNNNESWNCGFEGETSNKKVLNLRKKQMRNFMLALMISQGIPMILMGDEYGHTKKGNNNPWSQDNELNWFLWDRLEGQNDFFRFCRFLIHFRKNHPILRHEHRFTEKEIHWHGLQPNAPEWDKDNHFVAFSLHSPLEEHELYAAFNASHIYQTVTFPSCDPKHWHWAVMTQNFPPNDFFEDVAAHRVEGNTFRMAPYSSLLLEAL